MALLIFTLQINSAVRVRAQTRTFLSLAKIRLLMCIEVLEERVGYIDETSLDKRERKAI
jgi:hypothetical protein